jgi:hypothetical protein
MAKSPFSTAGGGNSDAKPHNVAARKHGGAVHHAGKHHKDGGDAEKATLKEAEGKKSIGFVEGEDTKRRLDRKGGGCARKHGGPVKHRAEGGETKHHEKHGHEHEHAHHETHNHVHHHHHEEHHGEKHGGRK